MIAAGLGLLAAVALLWWAFRQPRPRRNLQPIPLAVRVKVK